jgi:ankyrin repeat protein
VEPIMHTDDPVAVAVVAAIHTGDTAALRSLLESHAGLATVRLGDPAQPDGMTRTLMHVVADWPGHFPNGAATVAVLAELGADVNARFTGPHTETPLHWAASSDDVAVLDALLDAGADIDADGAVIAGGTPLMDAVAFAQWRAARRLVERGATVTFWQAAALGLDDLIGASLASEPKPTPDDIQHAFWSACHGGQLGVAGRLRDAGADVNWIPPWEHVSPLDAARRSGAFDLLTWLHGLGAKSAEEIAGCA